MKNINWMVRFKNKTFVITFATAIIAFIYQMLAMFGIVPKISQDMTINAIMLIVNVLATLGVIADPTTAGITDSKQALTYREPKEDK